MFRITKKRDSSIRVESDYGGRDHARAHYNSRVLADYMDKHEVNKLEGESYQDVKEKLWLKDKDKSESRESNVFLRLQDPIL